MLREYGWQQRYVSERQGRNSRLDEIQASILRVKLANLDNGNACRRAIAARYHALIDNPLIEHPRVRDQCQSAYHLYVVKTQARDPLLHHLKAHNIQAGIHYPIPIHLQPAYKDRVRTAMDPELSAEDVDRVASVVQLFDSITRYPSLD
jgi:dTDP-4-amino-4,6-dideoxygalactose transaminase